MPAHLYPVKELPSEEQQLSARQCSDAEVRSGTGRSARADRDSRFGGLSFRELRQNRLNVHLPTLLQLLLAPLGRCGRVDRNVYRIELVRGNSTFVTRSALPQYLPCSASRRPWPSSPLPSRGPSCPSCPSRNYYSLLDTVCRPLKGLAIRRHVAINSSYPLELRISPAKRKAVT